MDRKREKAPVVWEKSEPIQSSSPDAVERVRVAHVGGVAVCWENRQSEGVTARAGVWKFGVSQKKTHWIRT